MARIVGSVATSHTPIIGKTIAKKRENDPELGLKPFFDAFPRVREWVAEVDPDVVVLVYNDHGVNFSLENRPAFAIGTAPTFTNADEGNGAPPPRTFQSDPHLAWHIAQSLIEDEFDIATCQEMAFDHGGTTALDLLWPDHKVIPLIPVEINAVQPPLPTPRRIFKLGQALGKAIGSYPKDLKVMFLATGGLSHTIGIGGYINEEFDAYCMETLANNPIEIARFTSDDIVANGGEQGLEFLTWVVARGALPDKVDVVTSVYHKPISHTGGGMMVMEAAER
ncbi:protocatechuate 3,4-dioxygenase [Novosphingobium flavum]|uniref:Protocatechuate 3,4-dioxygenase n=1 Tax=Novosphingobium flavum TaxID=1778672 RepID=A0A7X1KMH9_9SPHN|nr:class III extradiol dioxygenase family protein [Novosphingobium flavum]MBC2666644.1 protocatechuate 3,4-dioxygenase [Novosphingobium flavum]